MNDSNMHAEHNDVRDAKIYINSTSVFGFTQTNEYYMASLVVWQNGKTLNVMLVTILVLCFHSVVKPCCMYKLLHCRIVFLYCYLNIPSCPAHLNSIVRTTYAILVTIKKYMFGWSTTQDRSTMHPKFDPAGVWTHDLQIMASTFHVTEMPALTTRPSVTLP